MLGAGEILERKHPKHPLWVWRPWRPRLVQDYGGSGDRPSPWRQALATAAGGGNRPRGRRRLQSDKHWVRTGPIIIATTVIEYRALGVPMSTRNGRLGTRRYGLP